jgi:hypothetical protein
MASPGHGSFDVRIALAAQHKLRQAPAILDVRLLNKRGGIQSGGRLSSEPARCMPSTLGTCRSPNTMLPSRHQRMGVLFVTHPKASKHMRTRALNRHGKATR